MRELIEPYFSGNALTLAPLVIFATLFVGVLVWVSRRGAKEHYRRMANLPLDERKNGER